MSSYQSLKLAILSFLNLDAKDVIHTYIGVGALLATAVILKKSLRAWSILIPGLVLSIGMEVLDLHDDLTSLGYARWNASIHDIINTNLIPLVIVILVHAGFIRANDQ